MSLAIGNTDRLAALKQEADACGHPHPAAGHQPLRCRFLGASATADGRLAIRYALAAVKKVGFAAMQAVVEARGDTPFADLADFAARVDPRQLNRMQLENLVKAGAFDQLEPQPRAAVRRGRNDPAPRRRRWRRRSDSGQIGLFGGVAASPSRCACRTMPDWPPLERLAFEAEAIGFHLTAHPLDAYAQALRRLGVTPCAQVEARAQAGVDAREARRHRRRRSRSASPAPAAAWPGCGCPTPRGSCEVTCSARCWRRSRELLADGADVLVTADLRLEGEALRITAQDVAPLDQAAAQAGAAMRVWLRETAAVPHIRDAAGA